MSFAIICPAAVQPDADAILQHLGRCDVGATAFTIALGDGSWAAHSWAPLWPDPMPAIPGYTTQQVADVVAAVQITPAAEVEARALFDAVLLAEGLAMAWVQPLGASLGTHSLGERVGHNGINWISRRAVNVWEPGTFDAGWQPEGPGPHSWLYIGSEGWLGPVAVTHGGSTYDLPAAATDFREPGTGGASWVVQAPPGPQPWVAPTGSHDAYPLGAMVTHNGRVWENTGSAANVWAPGVFGWVDRGPA